MNYYSRFPGDYLRDTMGLSMAEHGAYTLMLDYLYATEKPIKDLDHALAICGARTEEDRFSVQRVFGQFITVAVTGGYTQKRALRDLKERLNWRKRQKNHRDRSRDVDRDSHGMFTVSSIPTSIPRKEKPKSSHTNGEQFTPPTQQEVAEYMRLRKVPDPENQAELFIAHHANRKWKLSGGVGPVMVSWQKAVVTWQANIRKFGGEKNCERLPVNGARVGEGPLLGEHASPERAQQILDQIERQRAGKPH